MNQRYIWLGLITIVSFSMYFILLHQYIDPLPLYRKYYSNKEGHKLTNDTKITNLSIECFESPYILCQKPSEILKIVDSKNNETKYNNSPGNLPVIIMLNKGHVMREEILKFDFCQKPCVVKHKSEIEKADGILLDAVSLKDIHFPRKRYDYQVYMICGNESPIHYTGTLLRKEPPSPFNDQINIVSNYRVDSDIPNLYDILCLNDKPRKTRYELEQLHKSKPKMAVWLVSHCQTHSERFRYIRELQKYIDVDIFGQCGNKTFERGENETSLLTNTYKFYLSFENSMCKDYVTEKFFKLFHNGVYIVPVVRGGADYDKYFPPGTFINTAWYSSPSQLAQDLKRLANDREKYVEFLERRDFYTIAPYNYKYRKQLCSLCDALHRKKSESAKRYTDIRKWLTDDICHSPTDLP